MMMMMMMIIIIIIIIIIILFYFFIFIIIFFSGETRENICVFLAKNWSFMVDFIKDDSRPEIH